MRIGEISSSAEYRMDEELQSLPILGVKLWFSTIGIFYFYKFVNLTI